MSRSPDPLVILLDVDNTLLDGDGLKAELARRIERAIGGAHAERFWQLYEEVRGGPDGAGHVDVPETIARLDRELDDPALLSALSEAVFDLDVAALLLPGALDAVEHARTLGLPVILSDGDQVFQRHKIRASGLELAFEGRVFVFAQKEREIEEVRRLFPAEHYVLLDDKARILAPVKRLLGDAVTTVHVQQGNYAAADDAAGEVPPDLRIPSIAAFCELSAEELLAAAR